MLTGHVQIREFLADTRAMITTTALVLGTGLLSGYVLRRATPAAAASRATVLAPRSWMDSKVTSPFSR